jgi:hypothetical protein
VTYGRNGDDMGLVVNGVDDAVVAGLDTQVWVVADKLGCAGRAWLCFKAVNELSDRLPRSRV